MKRIRYWGTRGSLPVALTGSGVRDKLIRALRAASGKTFASDDELVAFVDRLGLSVSGSYGGQVVASAPLCKRLAFVAGNDGTLAYRLRGLDQPRAG